MSLSHRLLLVPLMIGSTAFTACGDDSGEGGSNGGAGDQGGDGGGGGTGYPPVECGEDLVCEAGSVCIIEPNAPECTNLREGQRCPKGTTETMCGGAGIPCCCGPVPPADFRCVSASTCEGEMPTCECVDPCTGFDDCVAVGADEYTFQCEPPAMP